MEKNTEPDLFGGSFEWRYGVWFVTWLCNGRRRTDNTGASTEAGARDWLRAAQMQYGRRGEPSMTTINADTINPCG